MTCTRAPRRALRKSELYAILRMKNNQRMDIQYARCTYLIIASLLRTTRQHGIWSLFPKEEAMPIPTLIVIGTSAGGVNALQTLIGALPNDLDAPVCIARHADPSRESLLPQILSRLRTLTVDPFGSGAQLLPGQLFVAPAGQQLLIEHTQASVLQEGPKRPRDDIDRLFQSAA